MFDRLLVPDTVDYMIAGYVVITIGIGLYLTSLITRWKRTVKEYSLLQKELD